jgi:integrase
VGRNIQRLSTKGVAAKRKRGYYADGLGLYLQVSETGTKSWIFRFRLPGMITKTGKPKSAEMGLGMLETVPLADARRRAADARKLVLDGINPIEARNAAKLAQARASGVELFSDVADAFIKANRDEWKSAKHASQWENTLSTYAYPKIGALPVHMIAAGHINDILQPIWTEKRETATRLRGRIEKILDRATALGYRTGPNPARWRGNLDHILPKDKRRSRIKHHAALPFDEIGAFLAKLHAQEGIAARALEFLILTAVRTGEVIGAKPDEFDLDAALWTIPAERMKSGREHRVPLSPRAVALMRALPKMGKYVFPGRAGDKPLSNMAMLQLLERMERDDLTVHGFRSTFCDWAAERTNFPREVCEMALAHAVEDVTEAAYRRGDLFEKRRRLMEEWATHCENTKNAGKVIPLRGAA